MAKEEDDTSKLVDEQVEEMEEELLIVDEAKVETGDSSSVSARTAVDKAMSSRENTLDSAIASLKSWGKVVGSTLGEAWSTVGDWKEEGKQSRNAMLKRMRLARRYYRVQIHCQKKGVNADFSAGDIFDPVIPSHHCTVYPMYRARALLCACAPCFIAVLVVATIAKPRSRYERKHASQCCLPARQNARSVIYSWTSVVAAASHRSKWRALKPIEE